MIYGWALQLILLTGQAASVVSLPEPSYRMCVEDVDGMAYRPEVFMARCAWVGVDVVPVEDVGGNDN